MDYKKAIDEELMKRDQAVKEKDERKSEMQVKIDCAFEELNRINKQIEGMFW